MSSAAPFRTAHSRALTAVGIFLIFGASMAALAGSTLAFPGTPLDKLWALNRPAYTQLAPVGRVVGPLFLTLSAALLAAAVGWFKRRLWGWRLTVGIIATQVVGDLVNFARGDLLRGGTGFVIASLLLLYLLRPKVKQSFINDPSHHGSSE
jgi:hypothetical protein